MIFIIFINVLTARHPHRITPVIYLLPAEHIKCGLFIMTHDIYYNKFIYFFCLTYLLVCSHSEQTSGSLLASL